jgi:hypothetical protein
MSTPAFPQSIHSAFSAWPTSIKASLLAAGLGLTAMQSSDAAVIPYTNDFSGTGSNVAFPNESPDAEWTMGSGTYNYSSNNTSSSTSQSTASVSLTNIGSTSFTMETQFTISSTGTVNSNATTIGMGFLGLTSDFSGTVTPTPSTAFYLADWQTGSTGSNTGQLRIVSVGESAGFSGVNATVDTNPGSSSLAINLDTTYVMRLVATYTSATSLSMTVGIFNTSGTQIGTSATATDSSALAGTYFGYRNRLGISGGTFNAAFDNFSVAPVPEPGTVALLGLGAGATLLMLRRRQRA